MNARVGFPDSENLARAIPKIGARLIERAPRSKKHLAANRSEGVFYELCTLQEMVAIVFST